MTYRLNVYHRAWYCASHFYKVQHVRSSIAYWSNSFYTHGLLYDILSCFFFFHNNLPNYKLIRMMQIYVYVSFEKSSSFSLRSWVLWQQTTAIYFQHFSEKDDKMLNRWELFLNTPGLISHATSVNLKYERKTYVYRSTKVVKYTWPINTFNSTSILLELHCVLWFMLRIHTYAVVGTKWRLD